MRGVAKGILITILSSVAIILFTNLIFFFPWYMTLVIETFNVSQVVSTDNYLRQEYYNDTMTRIQDRSFFKDYPGDVIITVENSDGWSAIGSNNPSDYYDDSIAHKPYRQRGEPVEIVISASFPLSITLWGTTYTQKIDASYSMTTTGLKMYKDLDY